jgi:hypothetical protein
MPKKTAHTGEIVSGRGPLGIGGAFGCSGGVIMAFSRKGGDPWKVAIHEHSEKASAFARHGLGKRALGIQESYWKPINLWKSNPAWRQRRLSLLRKRLGSGKRMTFEEMAGIPTGTVIDEALGYLEKAAGPGARVQAALFPGISAMKDENGRFAHSELRKLLKQHRKPKGRGGTARIHELVVLKRGRSKAFVKAGGGMVVSDGKKNEAVFGG